MRDITGSFMDPDHPAKGYPPEERDYHCGHCGYDFNTWPPVEHMDGVVLCPECGEQVEVADERPPGD